MLLKRLKNTKISKQIFNETNLTVQNNILVQKNNAYRLDRNGCLNFLFKVGH